MIKNDLKDGMVVENRKGNKYLVLGKKLMKGDSYYLLDDLFDDLTHCRYRDLDIIKVYETKACTITSIFNVDNLDVIWISETIIREGSIVNVVRSGERYTLYTSFFKNNNIDVDICLRYRYDDNDKFNDSDKFKVLKIIDDYVIIERRSINKPVYLFNLRGLEVVE